MSEGCCRRYASTASVDGFSVAAAAQPPLGGGQGGAINWGPLLAGRGGPWLVTCSVPSLNVPERYAVPQVTPCSVLRSVSVERSTPTARICGEHCGGPGRATNVMAPSQNLMSASE